MLFSAWQHVECVGIKSNSVPDTYLCDVCDPRPLDKERAKQIQTKKREEPTGVCLCTYYTNCTLPTPPTPKHTKYKT